jgi:hypothetical protein
MPSFRPFGVEPRHWPVVDPGRVERVEVQRPLRQVLSFTRRSIDDVVNSPVAKAEVLGYYKLRCWIHRRSEIIDLERQWTGRDAGPRR